MINIENLYFSYPNSPSFILNNINIFIPEGSYTSIIGDNGSCKSTLVKLMLNLLKPQKGNISINKDQIGYVPQKVEGFNSGFPITVKELLSCHAKFLGIKDKGIIDEALARVNMTKYKNSLIGNLSGGQQQRIFIGRALIGNPSILILDEPSTGIDINNQREIYDLLKTLNHNEKMTIISVEHNLAPVLKNSSHVIKMCDGKAIMYSIDEFTKTNQCSCM